jgi:nicotinamidase-related amidase
VRLVIVSCLVVSCARGPAPPRAEGTGASGRDAVPSLGDASVARDAADDAQEPDAGARATARAQLDPDGDDDATDLGTGALPAYGRFVSVGKPPLALTRICDLTPLGGVLYAAHANQPLGTDGATITRYDPADTKRPFSVAFDWNRPGEPTGGGGAGQGFVRVHAIGGRLVVPDADPPYSGFGLADHGTEGYVFVSDLAGKFAPPSPPHFRPPKGVGVVPRAYHVLDAIRFRGRFYASTGSVPPSERAWHGASPGALHVANEDLTRWTYETDYPFPWQNGVWRLSYLVRFADRLYAGIQDYDAREPNDYVVFAPPADATVLRREDALAACVVGTAQTLRWYADTPPRGPPRLFWIAAARDGVHLRVTEDGDTWKVVDLPADAGRPTDVTRFRDGVVVLTERRLLRLAPDGTTTEVARIDDKNSPFALGDIFCAAPLAVLGNRLYAGGQRGGTLFRLDED